MNQKNLSIATLALLSLAFLLIAIYKVYGGRNNPQTKLLGELGKIIFFAGVMVMAVNQYSSKEGYHKKPKKPKKPKNPWDGFGGYKGCNLPGPAKKCQTKHKICPPYTCHAGKVKGDQGNCWCMVDSGIGQPIAVDCNPSTTPISTYKPWSPKKVTS